MPAPPPPPPPPPPMPGAAGGPPPPPPPPPPANLPGRPDAKQAKGRGALLGDIEKGSRLKKVGVVNDRSAPILDSKSSNISAPPVGGAPPVPGLRPPTAPAANRARSNSDQGSIGGGATTAAVTDSAPQLGGILAGGIPKLKKTGGGINIYDSDPETNNNTRKSPPPTAPAASSNGPTLLRPTAPGAAPPLPPSAPPSVASLKNNLRPTIPSASTSDIPTQSTINKPKPPPPIGKKPPIPPPASRKPSSTATIPQSSTPTPPSAPPLPPNSTSPAPPSAPPPPPLPSSSAPKLPPAPPAQQLPNGGIQRETSLAEQAARNAFRGSSPAAPPPPPPPAPPQRTSHSQSPPESPTGAPPPPPPAAPPSRPVTAPAPPPPPPPPPPSAAGIAQRQGSVSSSQQQASLPPPPPPPPPATAKSASTTAVPTAGGLPLGSSGAPQLPPLSALGGASSYTLTNGSSNANSNAEDGRPGSRSASGRGPALWMEDSKFKFQRDDQLPKPRPFEGVVKRYRAGRRSSVPLDMSAFS